MDGSSTEKVPMYVILMPMFLRLLYFRLLIVFTVCDFRPMFEEDVPSVLELEMEELDDWMKKDGTLSRICVM